jgi:hypothetical protein
LLKTTLAARERLRRFRERHPQVQNDQKSRDYFNEYARRNRHKRNEQRRARRHRQERAERLGAIEFREKFGGLSIVTRDRLANDRTRFEHNAARYEAEIARLADEILAGRAVIAEAKARAEEIERGYRRAQEAHNRRKKK